MKALILSDIHSNIYALESIWAVEGDSDIVYATGDLVDYGPHPREVLDWVRAHAVICTQGNHDSWLAHHFRGGNFLENVAPAERCWVHHNASLLDEEDITFLESLPKTHDFELDGIAYGLAHLYQDYEEITSLHAYAAFQQRSFTGHGHPGFSRLILGHTHRQAVRYLSDTILWLNPGSVSYRRADDPDQSAHYATILDRVISLKRLPYDLRPVQRAIQGIRLKESENRVVEGFFGPRP